MTTLTELKRALDELFLASENLTVLLEPFDALISQAGMKSLKESGIRDKIKLTQLIIKLKEEIKDEKQ